jgi:hypothetical protein
MAATRKLSHRLALGLLWLVVPFALLGGFAYPGAIVWLEQHTILVSVVDADGNPVPRAEVANAQVLNVFT